MKDSINRQQALQQEQQQQQVLKEAANNTTQTIVILIPSVEPQEDAKKKIYENTLAAMRLLNWAVRYAS